MFNRVRPAQSAQAESPGVTWPVLLSVTSFNGGLWFASVFDSPWAVVLLAACAFLAGVVCVIVQQADRNSRQRRAMWEHYAEREIALTSAPLPQSGGQ
jgi:hypothetical protein